ncbi:hypothetical protein MJT46_018522 [Ovis ammon polii x Ovis aries]|nr:hypothetical protein MJT46_018522 [Ovis ammon polii x Ovis aries]
MNCLVLDLMSSIAPINHSDPTMGNMCNLDCFRVENRITSSLYISNGVTASNKLLLSSNQITVVINIVV